MKCSFCNKRAVYKKNNLYYCKDHFIKYFEAKVIATIKRYNMIEKGDRVGVAISGGKDSISLMYFLNKYKEYFGIKELIGIHIDEGIKGYRDLLTKYLLKLSKRLGWNIQVYRFKDYFGYTLDEAVKILKEIKPCTICGTWRRWLMNKAARELRLNKLATAHNLNDEAQTIFLNIIDGNVKDFIKAGPVVGIKNIKEFVIRMKPFYFISEKETMIYSLLNGISPPFTECPYIYGQIRDFVRKRMYELEDKYKFHFKLVFNYSRELEKVKDKFKGKFRIKKCKICGEPTSRDICRACEIRLKIEKLAKNSFKNA